MKIENIRTIKDMEDMCRQIHDLVHDLFENYRDLYILTEENMRGETEEKE